MKHVFTGSMQYIIPKYQRPYSWSVVPELTEFWDDFLALFKQYKTLGTEQARDSLSHFIGAIVIGERGTGGPIGAIPYTVIDGQQRLITLSLLLAAIRDELVSENEEKLEISNQYLRFTNHAGEFKDFKVVPGDPDRNSFSEIVRNQPISDATSRIAKAYNFFCKQLRRGCPIGSDDIGSEDSSNDQGPSESIGGSREDEPRDSENSHTSEPFEWRGLLDAAVSHLDVVSISGVAAENAYQVFRTLNATGTELSQVDLLRNAFFMLLPTRGPTAFDEIWKPLEQLLGEDLQGFLLTELLRQGYGISAKQIYRTQVRLLNRPGLSEADVELKLRELLHNARIYYYIRRFNEDYRGPERLRLTRRGLQYLNDLAEWGSPTPYPLILDAALRTERRELDKSNFETLLEWVLSLLIRRHVAEIPPNDLRSKFAGLMDNLTEATGAEYMTLVKRHFLHSTFRWPGDADIKASCLEKALFRHRNWKSVFFILKRIAMRLEGRECPHIVQGTSEGHFSIEHILPQGELTDAWREDLAEWGCEDPSLVHSTKCHLIGNLTLTAYNSGLAQRRFGEKRRIISEHSRLRLSDGVVASETWTGEQIDARSAILAQSIITIWPAPERE